jgi:hypothetical protein
MDRTNARVGTTGGLSAQENTAAHISYRWTWAVGHKLCSVSSQEQITRHHGWDQQVLV